MADVARLAGVSSQTVSRVSNGHPSVVDRTREQVLDAMTQLGYRPNGAARALKYGEFRTLGVVLLELSTVGSSRTVEAIVEHAAKHGYATTLSMVSAPSGADVAGAFTRAGELAIDAAIVVMEAQQLGATTLVLPAGIPVVSVFSDNHDRDSIVDTDQAHGVKAAVRHLLDLGHRTVHHVAGPADSYSAIKRAETWQATLREAGARVPRSLPGDWSAESGFLAGVKLARTRSCTAVFAANDQMALGVLRAFHEQGKAVPRDVSVIGFDNVPDSGAYIPPLTTVHHDFGEVGRRCVERALKLIEHRTADPERSLVPTHLVVRESTAPPPGRRSS
ncbi:LacI family DNA-binding transcriptional regulator [Lentzea sp. JNUCC 0626]|uniref:LacI family DNA-binding transcriptional regulator n=1 Tax=Lentzea sp. JNUCC 0626 TaxID=3367513 RepID=UPI0037491F97